MVVRNQNVSRGLFALSTILLVLIAYRRFDDPLHFGLVAGGLVTMSYFLLRGIRQLVGD